MKVFLVGNGGREHAILNKILQDVEKVYMMEDSYFRNHNLYKEKPQHIISWLCIQGLYREKSITFSQE